MIRIDDLPEFCLKPILVLGCGNTLFGDDGFGCAVAQRLLEDGKLPRDVCVIDAGTGARSILFTLTATGPRPRVLIVVDAIDASKEPGTVFEIDPEQIPAPKLDDFSLHQVPSPNLLLDLRTSCGVEVHVLACQTAALPNEITTGLSPQVADAVPQAVEWIRQKCARWIVQEA